MADGEPRPGQAWEVWCLPELVLLQSVRFCWGRQGHLACVSSNGMCRLGDVTSSRCPQRTIGWEGCCVPGPLLGDACLGHWRPAPWGLAACPIASLVLLFLFPLRFSLVAIKFFLPVQEYQVPSPQLVWDSSLPYLHLGFSFLAKEAQFVQFFSCFLVYCTTPTVLFALIR